MRRSITEQEFTRQGLYAAELISKGDFDKGILQLHKCFESAVRSRHLGKKHPATWRVIHTIGNLYRDINLLEDAETFYSEIYQTWKRPKKHSVAESGLCALMTFLGRVLLEQHKYQEAIDILTECRSIMNESKMAGIDHIHTAKNNSKLGEALMHADRCEEAVQVFFHVYEIRLNHKDFGKHHSSTLTAQSNLASAYARLGQFEQAIEIRKECLQLRKESSEVGPTHPDTIRTYSNLSADYAKASRFIEANSIIKEGGVHIAQSAHDIPDDLISQFEHNKSAIKQMTERPTENTQDFYAFYEQACNSSTLGPNHPTTLTYLYSAAYSLQAQGFHATAATMHHECWEKRAEALGEEHADTIESFIAYATASGASGEHSEAEDILNTKIDQYRDRDLSPREIETLCTTLNNLSDVQGDQDRLDEAVDTLIECMLIRSHTLHKDHPDLLRTLSNLTTLLIRRKGTDDYRVASHYLFRVLNSINSLRRLTGGIENRLAMSYHHMLQDTVGAAAWCHAIINEYPDSIVDIAEVGRNRVTLDTLSRNGLSLTDLAQQMFKEGAWDEARLQQFHKLNKLRIDLGERLSQACESNDQHSLQAALALSESLDTELSTLEQELIPSTEPCPIADCIHLLSKDEAILTYTWSLNFITLTFHTTNDSLPIAEPIAAANETHDLSDRINALYQSIQAKDKNELLVAEASELIDLLVPRIVQYAMANIKKVIVIPDGPLHQLPLGSIAELSGRSHFTQKLWPETPSISALSYLRNQGSKAKEAYPPNGHLLAIGNPSYSAAKSTNSTTLPHDSSNNELPPLPRSGTEAIKIVQLAKDSGWQSRSLIANEATQSHMLAHFKDCQILHLATHAFPGSVEAPQDARILVSPETNHLGEIKLKEILESFGGALKHCELAVLSACHSGSGPKIADSQIALPLGFMHMGAKNIVASRWKVDDTATCLLMIKFYEILLRGNEQDSVAQPLDPVTALQKAKQWLKTSTLREVSKLLPDQLTPAETKMMSTHREKEQATGEDSHPYSHPVYWASFAVTGAG